jgi:hypothetical protein
MYSGTYYIVWIIFGVVVFAVLYNFKTMMREDDRIREERMRNPYRTPAEAPSHTHESKSMNNIPKPVIIFTMLLPAMISDVGLGFAWDSHSVGSGAKSGMFIATALLNTFFIIMAITRAIDPENPKHYDHIK